jgi:hypothetical protein
MLAHKSINDLIEKGRGIAGKEFDRTGFLSWKSHALGYLASHFGPHHAYLQYFESFVRTPERMNILAGAGILEAAKEQMLLDPLRPTEEAGCWISAKGHLGVAVG